MGYEVTVEQARKISGSLRKLAKDIETTATGSSRIEMYTELADAVRTEAQHVDELVSVRVIRPKK